nr:immunoglobulin light chain junction region [Macaca mulatta]MOX72726.1 immunoglobulin light chain junction region [Macaca mulatta]MOX73565.1 immunoglobulin light chain junction region [Macaca mulatta]MOX74186.1 immunoglobulin light chain junction region [Macaca mulatta]MOX76128.1 immunoglobulin light chain junction region [Macaca mulatta]
DYFCSVGDSSRSSVLF